MLVIETTRNGQRVVTLKKDWNPSRIGRAYNNPAHRTYVEHDKDMLQLQRALLKTGGKQ